MDKLTDTDLPADASDSGGAAGRTSATPAQLKAIRRQRRLLEEQIEVQRLTAISRKIEGKRQLTEGLDWVQPWTDIVRQAGPNNLSPFAPASRSHRKHGQYFPVYRTEYQLNLLRAASRSLIADNEFAQGVLTGLRGYVIGTGYTYRATPKATVEDDPVASEVAKVVQRIVDEIVKQNDWAGGELGAIENEAFDRSFEDGEFFLRAFYQDDGWTQFRFPEPEQITEPQNVNDNEHEWSFGICTRKRDVQTAVGYWVVYGDTAADGDLCEPNEITHYRRKAKRNMKRGWPEFSFGVFDLFDLAKELAANLAAGAAEQATIASVMQTETGTVDEITAVNLGASDGQIYDRTNGSGDLYRTARRRENQTIGAGQKYIEGPVASNAQAHVAALNATLLAAGRPWQCPEWLTSGNANGMNYATSLTAESPFVIWVKEQQKGYKAAFSRAIWGAVEHYVKTKSLRAAGREFAWAEVSQFIELVVEAPDPVTRDPLAEAQRFQIDMPMGVDSPQAYCERNGRDYDRVQKDLEEHVLRTGGAGEPLPMPPDQPETP